MKILLTDIGNRKSFDVYNCLKKLNYDLILTSDDLSLCNRLVYAEEVYELNKSTEERFVSDLEGIVKSFRNEKLVFVPVEEDTILLFFEYVEKYGQKNFCYALPDKFIFELSRDKKRLSRFCDENEIPHPRELTLERLKNDFVEVVAKPCVGSGSKGLIFVHNQNELEKLTDCGSEYLVQELMPNPAGVQGAFFLFNRGKEIGFYGHKRLRTYPVKAGVTVFSEIEFDSRIRKAGSRLLEKLNWHGLAMVEFLLDPITGNYNVIEINPRVWGSFLLSEFAGTGFLKNYVNLSLGLPIEKFTPRQDVKIRWFFPFDLVNYIERRGAINNFWSFDTGSTCYIGFTYANKLKSLLFILCSIINVKKLKKFLEKVFN